MAKHARLVDQMNSRAVQKREQISIEFGFALRTRDVPDTELRELLDRPLAGVAVAYDSSNRISLETSSEFAARDLGENSGLNQRKASMMTVCRGWS